jgi:glutathione S-transferase
MKLIGMFDSPFVRRVAVSIKLLGMPFEHLDWSIGRDFERIREYNPLGRVPTLVTDDGEALIESAAILDYLNDTHTGRELLAPSGPERRNALRVMALASGAAEKGVLQIYETVFRTAEKRHEPWVARCRTQMYAALAELERIAAATPTAGWRAGDGPNQALITVVCVFDFLSDAFTLDGAHYPALRALSQECAGIPAFNSTRRSFHAPVG